MDIRKAQKKDIQRCVELSKIKEFKTPILKYPDSKFFNECLDDAYFFVAEDSGVVVGYTLGYKFTKSSAYIDFLSVDKKERGKGVGKALFDHIRKAMKKDGVKDYFLISPVDAKSNTFYEKLKLKKGKKYWMWCEEF